MLSVFPQFLSYWMFVPLIFRFAVGLYFFNFGYEVLNEKTKWESKKRFFEDISFKPSVFFVYAVSIFEMIAGVMLMMGFLVQVVAVVLSILTATIIAIKTYGQDDLKKAGRDVSTYILLLVILLSLLLLGAGYYGIDYPL